VRDSDARANSWAERVVVVAGVWLLSDVGPVVRHCRRAGRRDAGREPDHGFQRPRRQEAQVLEDLDRRWGLRRPWLSGVAALALVTCASAACQSASRQPPATRSARLARYQGVTADALARGGWSRLPAAPIPDRDAPVGVWTGRELLVWGGQSGPHDEVLHGDGAAYDPARRVWRELPPAPLTPRTGAAAAWTGRELIVWGGYDHVDSGGAHVADDGAAYDPVRGAWRQLSPAPLSARADATAVWTGREVLVVGGAPAVRTDRDRGFTDGAAYDPVHDSWRRLAPSPQPRGSLLARHLVWTATRLLVWSDWRQTLRSDAVTLTGGERGVEIESQDGVDVWAYDPAADRWTVLPPAPGQPALGGAVLVWTGQEVLSMAGRPYQGPALDRDPSARYDPARNRWRRLADGPLDTAALPVGLWTGAALLVWNGTSERSGDPATDYGPGDGAAWDPRADRWVRLPRSPLGGDGGVAVWTGRAALVWGGRPWPTPAAHTGMVFTPAGS
jgi:N-acetylneuraminic acid mutarotase